jgi:hypothetical protein
MATYYVRKTGSDAAAGTSAGAAWLTWGKALGASGASSGDTVYIGPGIYREAVTVAAAPASTLTVIVDVDGSHTGDAPGDVILTGYTTDDVTLPAASNVTLAFGSNSNFAISKATIVAGKTNAITGLGTNYTLTDCVILHGASAASNLVSFTPPVDTNSAITLDRCVIDNLGSGGNSVLLSLPTSASADYDCGFVARNCTFLGGFVGVRATPSGAASFKPGGGSIVHCTFAGQSGQGVRTDSNFATSIPLVVKGCGVMNGGTGLQAATSGQISESGNLLHCNTARSNVTAGAGSFADYSHAPLVEVGQAGIVGRAPVPFLTPTAGSGWLGLGTVAGAPSVDALNRPRPAGGASTSNAVGAYERHDSGVSGGATDADGGSGDCLKLTGPADHDLSLAVDATSTTISVKVRWDGNHGDAAKPQASLLASGEIGYAGETKTATSTGGTGATLNSYETLTFAAFTPTQKSVVTLRLVSRSAAGSGVAKFDSVGIS